MALSEAEPTAYDIMYMDYDSIPQYMRLAYEQTTRGKLEVRHDYTGAFDKNSLLGFIGVSRNAFVLDDGQKAMVVESLFVPEEHRGNHIGTSLIKNVIQQALGSEEYDQIHFNDTMDSSERILNRWLPKWQEEGLISAYTYIQPDEGDGGGYYYVILNSEKATIQ